MTLNFPTDPGAQTPVNTYGPDSTPLSTDNGVLYTWDGDKWVANKQISYDGRYVNVTGDTMTGDLTVPNLVSQGDVDGVNGDFSGNITAANLPTNGSIVGYQQGTWIPVPSEGAIDPALTPNRWVWSRIGNTVTISAFAANITGTSANEIAFSGVPYTATSIVAGAASGSRIARNSLGITCCLIRGGIDNTIQFLCSSQSGIAAWAAPRYSDADGGAQIYFSVTYLTDDTTWTPINGATVD